VIRSYLGDALTTTSSVVLYWYRAALVPVVHATDLAAAWPCGPRTS
jgi:hypothetical protein